MNGRRTGLSTILGVAILLAGADGVRAERELDEQESYSYVRVLEGRATLTSAGEGPGADAELNQPLLAGDRVEVGRGARLEIALADRNLLRMDEESSVTLDRIAFSGDRGDRSSRFDVERGEVLLWIGDDALGDQLPELRTPHGEIVIYEPGTYRLTVAETGWTELVVREGFAEVVTARGSTLIRSGEMALVEEDRRGLVEVLAAASFDALERWSDELGERADRARQAVREVDPSLAYQAATLADHGSWVTVDSVNYWRPRVETGWRPYWRGRWTWTPSGLTWVSSEPWGWVPYHYGSWCTVPDYGWVWRPGRIYSPAWVYWHWSDSWVGWVPTGYYTSWYGSSWNRGFRWGHYGRAGGSWNNYSDWCFRPTRNVCDRDWRRHQRRGGDMAREFGNEMPNGVVTTDTRSLPRHRFSDPGVAREELLRRVTRNPGGGIPDVTDFVARRRDLPPPVRTAVEPGQGDRIRLADVPIATDTDGGVRGNPRVVPGSTRPRVGDRTSQGPRPVDRGNSGPVPGGRVLPRDDDGGVRGNPRVVPGSTRPRDDDGGVRGNPRVVPGSTRPRDEGGQPLPGTTGPRVRPRGDVPVVVPDRPAPGDRGHGAPVPPPDDRQGWRQVGSDRPLPGGGGSPQSGLPPRSRPTIQPGDRVEVGSDGRTTVRPGGTRPIGAPPDGGVRNEQPVQRVLGGVRRSDGTSQGWRDSRDRPAPAGGGAPASGYSSPSPRLRYSGDRPVPGSAPSYVRPDSQRPSGPAPRVQAPSRQAPTSVRPSSPSSAPRSTTSAPSGSRTSSSVPPPSRTESRSSSSSRKDSPPPRRDRDHD